MLDKVNTLCYYQYAMTKQEWLQVRMDSEEKAELQALADKMGLKMSDVVRDALNLYVFFQENYITNSGGTLTNEGGQGRE